MTLKEIHIANGSSDGPGLWTVLYVIPFVNFLAYWHYSDQYAKFTGQGEPFLYTLVFFILWIVFSPAVWFFVQRDLNSVAGGPA